VSYLRKAIASLLKVPDSPRRTAFAFAIGVFIGFSPFLGLHTVMGVAVAFLFRLNKIAVILGVWSNVPWLLVPFYSFATWVGVKAMGLPEGITPPNVGLSDLFKAEFWIWLGSQWQLLIPAFFGSLLLSVILALLAYPSALFVINRYRART
jgi:uncharacterized protein (DUF2062 family)